MDNSAILTPGCKVNLILDILGRRPDGFHDLETLFWPLPEPTDRLEISPGPPGSGLVLTCSIPDLQGPDNTVCKAYEAFARATGLRPDLAIRLDKQVPLGAGLGGGSADAAALLRRLNENAGPAAPDPALTPEALAALAASVGADAPFFLQDGPAWARGRGDRLTLAEPDLAAGLAGLWLVLVLPPIHVSTAWAYQAWDQARAEHPADPPEAHHSLTCGPGQIKRPLYFRLWVRNGFEDIVFARYPTLREYKEKLLRLGAAATAMSGSGAGIFALFRDRKIARGAADAFGAESIPAHVQSV